MRALHLLVMIAVLAFATDLDAQEGAAGVEVPRFGLVLTDVTALMARHADLDRIKGAFVQSVAGGSPAAVAGLQAGDIITSLNDRGIRTARELKNDLSGLDAEEVGKMCVVHDDYRTTLYIAATEPPAVSQRPSARTAWLGVDATNVTPGSQESSRLEEVGKDGGILVERVIAGSPAAQAGIQPGDVLMSFNSRKVRTVRELNTDLAGAQPGATARICVMRGDIRKTLYPVLGPRPEPAARLTGYEESSPTSESGLLDESVLGAVFPQASRFSRREQPLPHYRAIGPRSELLGVAFVTTEICPEQSQGYQGPISTLVGIGTDGRIVGVRLLEHSESPKYTRGHLEEFVEQYRGRDATEPLVLGSNVDAISGATITSAAINRSIAVGSTIVYARVLQADPPTLDGAQTALPSPDPIVWRPELALLAIIVALALVGYYTRHQIVRYLVLGMSFIHLGCVEGGGFSVHDAINILQGDLPVFSAAVFWYALLAVITVTTLLIGRFYCGWLCPFGALSEMLYRVVPGLRIVVPPKADRWLRLLKYLVLIAILFVVVAFGQQRETSWIVDVVEPFGTTFRLSGSVLAWSAAALFLVASIFVSRAYCRYLCPLGAFFAVAAMAMSLARRALFRTKSPGPHPRALVGLCPVGAIRHERYYTDLGTMNGECIVCLRRGGLSDSRASAGAAAAAAPACPRS